MNKAELRAPWEFSKPVFSLSPVAGNAAQNGAPIDRVGYLSVIADVVFSCSGTPTGGTITAQLQDSADGVTFANFGAAAAIAIPATPTASGVGTLAIDLGLARRYVRVVTQGAPTGGSSPVVSVAHAVRLYGPDRLPAI